MRYTKAYTIIGILAIMLFSLTLISALTLTDVSTPLTTKHNQDVTITFNLTAGAEEDFTALDWTTSTGNWKTLPILTTINAGETKTLTAVLTVPQHSTGSASAELIVSTIELTSPTDPLPIIIPIEQTPELSVTQIQALTRNQNATFNVSNSGNVLLSNIGLAVVADGDFEVNLSTSSLTLSPGESEIIQVASNELDSLDLKSNTVTITAADSFQTQASTSFTVAIDGSFCGSGDAGNHLTIERIKDKSALDKDWEWKPLDNVLIEVEVDNAKEEDGSFDKDVIVELRLVDADGNEVDFAEDEDNLEDEVSINEDESKRIEFDLKISSDVEEGSYTLYVKAYEDGEEDVQCISDVAELGNPERIRVEREKHDVLVKEVEGPSVAACDSRIDLEAKVYNIGKEDEDKAKVVLLQQELGITLEQEVEDLSEGDSERILMSFVLPEDAEEKEYEFRFLTKFDYDEDDDTYDKSSDSDAEFSYRIVALGNCQVIEPTVNAILYSEAKFGTDLVVKVEITNPLDETTDFVISPEAYESWADFVNINPLTLTLDAGETGEALVTLNPTQSGSQNFDINIVYDGQTSKQPVSVNIAEKSGLFTGAFAGDSGLYTISGIFLVLVVIVVVLIVKVARPSKPAEF